MPHQVFGRHLGRNEAQRRALFRNLITALFRHESIKTTEAKAKAIRGEAEKLITRAKRGEPGRLVQIAQDGDATRLSAMVGGASAERLLGLARNGQTAELEKAAAQIALHARRVIMRTVHDGEVADHLIHNIAAEFAERPGGYTRILKIGPRQGDAADMVVLSLVE